MVKTVTPDFRVRVSERIRAEYENGRDYYALRDREIVVRPRREADCPSAGALGWHNEHVFR